MAAPVIRRSTAPILDPTHQRGLVSLLSQTYNKPVELRLTRLTKPHQDADLLAQLVTQRQRGRHSNVRRILRSVTWKVGLPSPVTISNFQQERQERKNAHQPLTLDALKHGPTPKASEVMRDLNLSQVTSIRVKAAGRLSNRIAANRSMTKVSREGATSKGEDHLLKGWQKVNKTDAKRSGKRKIGGYGISVELGHS